MWREDRCDFVLGRSAGLAVNQGQAAGGAGGEALMPRRKKGEPAANSPVLLQWMERGLSRGGRYNLSGLARALDIHPSQATRMMRDQRRIQLHELPKIAEYLEMEVPADVMQQVFRSQAVASRSNGATQSRGAGNDVGHSVTQVKGGLPSVGQHMQAAREQDAVAELRMAIEIVKGTRVPTAANPDVDTEKALRVLILDKLERRLKELAG
jgi:hypothetical protein